MESIPTAIAHKSPTITKEFLEKALNFQVGKFLVNPGSSVGDGYTCILYSVDVWKVGDLEPLHLLIKSFPSNPVRQHFLEQGGIFGVELGMYDTVIPQLIKFQEDAGVENKINPPFAPFLAGKYTPKDQRDGTNNPLDNYIIMTDLRKSGGYRLRDRFQGFDLDHYKLVIEAQATLHALSWAYKCKQNVNIVKKFPCLSIKGSRKVFDEARMEFLKQNMESAEGLVNDDPDLAPGFAHLKSVIGPICRLYAGMDFVQDGKHYTKDSILREPAATVENEEPWEVLLHGDASSNNMLFRYDPVTGKPVQVLFVDLQVSREGDPLTDVNFALYVSTSDDLRTKHLSSMLYIYYDTFTQICKDFSVPTLPGWNWAEFTRRFHRAQIFGAYMASALLPLLLKNPDEIIDMDKIQIPKEQDFKSENFMNSEWTKRMMTDLALMKKPNPVLESRLRGAIGDAVRAGVTWDEAVEVCSEAGLTTAVINNKAESDALGAASLMLAKQGKDSYQFWLGANLKNGKWIWAANGKELTYTNWSPTAELNLPATSPTDGYECGYISVSTWGTWACAVEYAVPVGQSKQA